MTDIIIAESRCPITGEVFLEPVIASDGYTYEKCAIEEWMKRNGTSPITREKLKKKLTINRLAKKLVEKISCEDRHSKNCPICAGIDKRYLDIRSWDENMFTKLSENHLKIIIDNMNLESANCFGQKPIHFICEFSTPEIIKYIINKKVDLESATDSGWRPVHILCQYSTPEMVKYIINEGVDLETVNDNGWKPIHILCRYSTPEMVEFIVDEEVNLESAVSGWKPVHFACRYLNAKMIKYIINKGVRLDGRIEKYDGEPANYSLVDLIKFNEKLSESEKIELINILYL